MFWGGCWWGRRRENFEGRWWLGEGSRSSKSSAGKVRPTVTGSMKVEIRLPQQQETVLGRQVHSDYRQHSVKNFRPDLMENEFLFKKLSGYSCHSEQFICKNWIKWIEMPQDLRWKYWLQGFCIIKINVCQSMGSVWCVVSKMNLSGFWEFNNNLNMY